MHLWQIKKKQNKNTSSTADIHHYKATLIILLPTRCGCFFIVRLCWVGIVKSHQKQEQNRYPLILSIYSRSDIHHQCVRYHRLFFYLFSFVAVMQRQERLYYCWTSQRVDLSSDSNGPKSRYLVTRCTCNFVAHIILVLYYLSIYMTHHV